MKVILGDDCISRQAVLDLIADYDLSMGQVVKGIHALPSVTPQEPIDYKAQYERFSKKAEIVISQLRADRDRLLEDFEKMRAEIEKLRPNLRPEQMTDYDYAMVEIVDDIVAILDKYKAESEVEDESTN